MAVAVTAPPAGTVAVPLAVIAGVALATTDVVGPHVVAAARLATSPPKLAIQLYVPGLGGLNGWEVKVPFPVTVAVDVVIGLLQLGSPGPYTEKLITPVGEAPPLRLAEAEIVPPIWMLPSAATVKAGAALVTDVACVPQTVLAGALLVSPPYVATQL